MRSDLLARVFVLAALAGFGSTPASAQTCNVPGSYPTIQSAIDDAGCATVAIAAGTYYENLYVWRGVTLAGAGAANTAIDGSNANSVVYIPGSLSVTLQDLTVQHGVNQSGGGISSWAGDTVALARVVVANNTGYFWGAGILNYFGTFTIADSTITNNFMPFNDGAGMRNFGVTTITTSTFSNNSTSGFGGGVASSGLLQIANSTFTGNTGGYGGGIGNDGAVTIDFSTLAGNNSTVYPGGAISSNGGSIQLHNSIMAGNVNNALPSDYFNWQAIDPVGLGNNLTTTQSTAGFTIVALGDLNLQPLADNGGPTQTMKLAIGSVAIDTASDCSVPTDQRGVSRPQGPACDVGAYEAAPPTIADLTTLVAALPLSASDAAPLLVKLNGALADLASGGKNSANSAKGKLGAFINQTNADIKSHKLTAAQGNLLVTAATSIIAGL